MAALAATSTETSFLLLARKIIYRPLTAARFVEHGPGVLYSPDPGSGCPPQPLGLAALVHQNDGIFRCPIDDVKLGHYLSAADGDSCRRHLLADGCTKDFRKVVPTLDVMIYLICCSKEGLCTNRFAMLVWSFLTTADVSLSDMAQRTMLCFHLHRSRGSGSGSLIAIRFKN